MNRHGFLELQLSPSFMNQPRVAWSPTHLEEKLFLKVVPLLLFVKSKRSLELPRASGNKLNIMKCALILWHTTLTNSPRVLVAVVWQEALKDAVA